MFIFIIYVQPIIFFYQHVLISDVVSQSHRKYYFIERNTNANGNRHKERYIIIIYSNALLIIKVIIMARLYTDEK